MWDRRDQPHITVTTAFTDYTVPKKKKAVINMGELGLVRVQPEFQMVFEHAPTLLPEGFCLCTGAFDNKHEVIGIQAVRYSRFSMTANFGRA